MEYPIRIYINPDHFPAWIEDVMHGKDVSCHIEPREGMSIDLAAYVSKFVSGDDLISELNDINKYDTVITGVCIYPRFTEIYVEHRGKLYNEITPLT